MDTIHTVNEIEWINSHLQRSGLINRDQVSCVTNFSLLWNLFEGHVCAQNASIRKFESIISRLAQDGVIQREDFEKFLSYYRSRYVEGGQFKSVFYGLRFRPNDRQKLVEDVLLGKNNDVKDIVLALLIIVYRLRNNLFHGIKSLYDINSQVDNFLNANGILMKIIELYKN